MSSICDKSIGPKPRREASSMCSTVAGSTPMIRQHTASIAGWLFPTTISCSFLGMGVSMRPSPATIPSMTISLGCSTYCRSATFSLSR